MNKHGIKSYVKKPVEIQAVLYDGTPESLDDLTEFGVDISRVDGDKIIIPTLEGNMRASVGDFVIKGLRGEYYPCKPDIFWQTYNLKVSKVNYEG